MLAAGALWLPLPPVGFKSQVLCSNKFFFLFFFFFLILMREVGGQRERQSPADSLLGMELDVELAEPPRRPSFKTEA